MLSNSTEMVEYTSACRMAAVFDAMTKRLLELQAEMDECCNKLDEAFDFTGHSSGRGFSYETHYFSRQHSMEDIIKLFKLNAWARLIEKLGVQKLMSSKKQEELRGILYSQNPNDADKYPDLTEDTIMGVLQGYASSAEEFLHEAIREEYDYWKPVGRESNYHKEYKTNQTSIDKNSLDRKVIKGWCVYRSCGHWEPEYNAQAHMMALDNIFHLLDGKGHVKGHRGPLVDAIRITTNNPGSGETEYFSFRLFENKNIHLTFKRLDLLEKFNAICGRNWLGNKK